MIGTERHESRRIDNQLRGRSGRQGDPGVSRFFVSLDDEIMRIFGGETISNLMTRFNMPENMPLQHMIVSRAIEQAQSKVEGFNFDIRKHLVDYDDVLNKQREIIYKRRRKILEGTSEKESSTKDEMLEKINMAIATIVNLYSSEIDTGDKSQGEKISDDFVTIIPFDENSKKQLVQQIERLSTTDERINLLSKIATDVYEKREQHLGKELMRQIERFVILSVVDNLWMDHLDAIENLRGGIGLRGYGQRDPLVEYKNEAFKMFEQLISGIDDEIVHRIYKIQVQQAPIIPHQHQHVIKQAAGDTSISPSLQSREVSQPDKNQGSNQGLGKNKLGRNDKCWCGSGKKYKKCHYPN